VAPDLAEASRAGLAVEGIEALRQLWNDRRASYAGKYHRFDEVESFPKPVQDPLPIYSGGNVEGSMRRAGELCDGWLPAKIGPDKLRAGRQKVEAYARAAGRDPARITTALQSVVRLGDTKEQVRERFERSAFELFRKSLQKTMTKGVDLDAYFDANLIGTPDEVCAKVRSTPA
jgi:alkanesulfonate monooxygenase SsuD/methylene tetrahydromethanopterin reductase-like flavin-dependent oxidoreductase (luciferase family)